MTRSNALRGRWKPWTWSTRAWMIAIVLSVMVSPFVSRWFCLWQVPDVVLPFDVEDVIKTEVPEEQNAFAVYENVLKMLASDPVVPANSATEPTEPKSEIGRDELLQRLLSHNEQALAEFIREKKKGKEKGTGK